MPFFQLIFLGLLLLARPVFALTESELLPPEQVFKPSVLALTSDKIEIVWHIADGYSLYRNNMRFEAKTAGIELGEVVFPDGEVKHDEFLGDVVHYHHELKVTIPLVGANGKKSVQVETHYQGCADEGICYPPQKKMLTVELPVLPAASTGNPLAQLVKKIPSLNFSGSQDDLLPPEQAFEFSAFVKNANTLYVNWEIAPNYYLYREKIKLELLNGNGTQLGDYFIPNGIPKRDEAFGAVEIFYDGVNFDVPINRANNAAQTVILHASYQGCAERGVCYPPMTKDIELTLPITQQLQALPSSEPVATTEPVSEQDQIVRSLHQDSLIMTLLSFFGFGFLLSLTPCIFPMIPILSGIIVGHGKRVTTGRAFLLSLSYVVASALAYTVFGVLAALFGGNLQSDLQQPWVISLFSLIFVALSLSMFGFYELELPNALKTKLHNSSIRHQDGSLWGAAIMGALSSLIVGPCVAAPLAGALIYIGQTGDAWLGGSALFMLGLGMGFPLLLLGASAGKLLPKAGSWMITTKAVFGVIMLAVAVWMLSRIIAPTVALLLWAMLLIVPSIYCRALDALPDNSSGWQKLWKGLGVLMLAYGVLLLIGVGMGNSNPLKPLQGVTGNVASGNEELRFERVASLNALTARLQQAASNHQIVMLDFYADWCISCKEMEAYTFTDKRVQHALKDFVLLQADVTANAEDDKALLTKFNLIGPPAILFFDSKQQEKTAQRVVGYQDADTFLQTLQQVKP